MKDTQRRFGHVTHVARDEDHGTVYLMGTFLRPGQVGFGGLALDAEGLAAFEREVAAIFGVETLEQCVGEECWGLWCRGQLNETVEGIETMRGRVTLSGFTRRHSSPGQWRSAKLIARMTLEHAIAHARRRLEEAEAELAAFEGEDFIDWESAPPSTFE